MNKGKFLRDNPSIRKFEINGSVYGVYIKKTSKRHRWILKKGALHVKLNNREARGIADNINIAEQIWEQKRTKEEKK